MHERQAGVFERALLGQELAIDAAAPDAGAGRGGLQLGLHEALLKEL